MNRPLSYLAMLGTLYTGSVHADDFKPDFHLIEYQFFVPSLWPKDAVGSDNRLQPSTRVLACD